MGLDFTSIPDKEGAALYMLHNGNSIVLQQLTRLKDEIAATSQHQVVLVDVHTPDGEQIRDFYNINADSLPVLMIIADDDSILYQWSGSSIPTNGSDIVYQLNQINGPA
jgi:arginine repressor